MRLSLHFILEWLEDFRIKSFPVHIVQVVHISSLLNEPLFRLLHDEGWTCVEFAGH